MIPIRPAAVLATVIALVVVLVSSSPAVADSPSPGTLVDVKGNTIALWEGKNPNASNINKFTKEPADGSEIAKKIRPGAILIFDTPILTIHEQDEQGNLLPDHEVGTLVANHSVITADGELKLPGDPLNALSFIDEGFVKNPGPDNVTLTFVYNGISADMTIEPGDGFFVGTVDEAVASGPVHERGCTCECVIGLEEPNEQRIRIIQQCPGCEGGEQGCCCERDNNSNCVVRDQDQQALIGTAINCVPALIPT